MTRAPEAFRSAAPGSIIAAASVPPDWYYHGFPLPSAGDEALSLDWVTEVALRRMDEAAATGDEAHFGPVLHWAHILRQEQGPDGDWPRSVNTRTGDPIGEERTRRPADLLQRLGGTLRSVEFDDAVARARSTGR